MQHSPGVELYRGSMWAVSQVRGGVGAGEYRVVTRVVGGCLRTQVPRQSLHGLRQGEGGSGVYLFFTLIVNLLLKMPLQV